MGRHRQPARHKKHRRRGVATWLLGQAAGWLRLAQVTRLLGYASLDPEMSTGPDLSAGGEDEAGYRAFLAASGFAVISRTLRGWTRSPRPREP